MSKLIISTAAVTQNYQTLKNKFSGADAGAVVKANGYGLGAAQIAKTIANAGCKNFFVATVEEGIELRKTLPSENIFIFHGAQKTEVAEFEKHKLIPVLNNTTQLAYWPKDKPAAAQFDTGMTRLGFAPNEADKLKDYNISLVMSHLANAEDSKNPNNAAQLEVFKKIAAQFPKAKKSLCNSAGISLGNDYHFDLSRPGIALYGGFKNMKDVVTLTAPIIQIHEITKPVEVGYGGEYTAKIGDIIATIPLGYADGILRKLGNRGKCYIGEYELPIVGRVSMDLITIKINNLPAQKRIIGENVEIIGEKYNICDMARDAETIEYEIITRLGNRFERVYK